MTARAHTSERIELEMVQRHIHEGAKRIARQLEIVADFRAKGFPTELAEALLGGFRTIQLAHEAHLARLETAYVEPGGR